MTRQTLSFLVTILIIVAVCFGCSTLIYTVQEHLCKRDGGTPVVVNGYKSGCVYLPRKENR